MVRQQGSSVRSRAVSRVGQCAAEPSAGFVSAQQSVPGNRTRQRKCRVDASVGWHSEAIRVHRCQSEATTEYNRWKYRVVAFRRDRSSSSAMIASAATSAHLMLHELNGRHLEVELVGVVLIDDGDPHFGVALDLALGWLE